MVVIFEDCLERFQLRASHAFIRTIQLVPKTVASNQVNSDRNESAAIAGHHFDTIHAKPLVAVRTTRPFSRRQLILGFLLFNVVVWCSVLWIALRG
jgi:hypothetical protein